MTLLLLVGFVSCKTVKTSSSPAPSATIASSTDIHLTPSDSPSSSYGQKPLNILFAGNSQLSAGGVPEAFDLLCKANNKNIQIYKVVYWGYTLSQIIDTMDIIKNPKDMDIVVLGDWSGVSGANELNSFKSLFSEHTKFYYIADNTMFGSNVYDTGGFIRIPTYEVRETMLNDGFTMNQLQAVDGMHWNFFNSYCMAICTYGVIYREDNDITGIFRDMLYRAYRDTPGVTDDERDAALDKVYDVVAEVLGETKW